MSSVVKRAGLGLRRVFESVWHYLGSMAAVCLFAAVLGLGIYHAVVKDEVPRYACYAGVFNPAGAEPPGGVVPLGAESPSGVPHVRMEYDASGRLQRMRSLDAAGRMCALPGSKVAEQRVFYHPQGYLSRRENRDVAGRLVADAQGVAVREFDYDAAGRSVATRYLNEQQELVVPRFPGYAECRTRYDAEGRPLVIEYLDAAGQPLVNAIGEQRVEYEYADEGRRVIRRNVVNGALADNAYGVAQECYRVMPQGASRNWSNAAGEPVAHPLVGAELLRCEQYPLCGLHRRRFLGADGAPYDCTRERAEHLMRCNEDGQVEWECFSGGDGLPVNDPRCGYAERVCMYSPQGELQREYFWDAAGKPAAVAELRHENTPHGRFTLQIHRDGATTVQPGQGARP